MKLFEHFASRWIIFCESFGKRSRCLKRYVTLGRCCTDYSALTFTAAVVFASTFAARALEATGATATLGYCRHGSKMKKSSKEEKNSDKQLKVM